MPTKFQVVEIWVESTAASRYGSWPKRMSIQKAMVLTTNPVAPTAANPAARCWRGVSSVPRRRRVRWTAKRRPSRKSALLSPECRGAKLKPTSATFRRQRATASRRILKPTGRRLSMSTAASRSAKNPLIGSDTSCRRRGKADLVSLVAAWDTPTRERLARPTDSPWSR